MTPGIQVCLLTGFSPATRDAIVDRLGWQPLIDLALSPADAGRGRPWPDLPLTALLRLGGGAVSELAVVGDTPSDIETGRRAGAGLVAGVLTGRATRDELEAAKAPHVLDTIADLLPLVGVSRSPARGRAQVTPGPAGRGPGLAPPGKRVRGSLRLTLGDHDRGPGQADIHRIAEGDPGGLGALLIHLHHHVPGQPDADPGRAGRGRSGPPRSRSRPGWP